MDNQLEYNKYLIPEQYEIMILAYNYFLKNSKGIFNIFCRFGKTRLSCLLCKYSLYKKIVIVVPSLYLIDQTYLTWINFFNKYQIKKISCQDQDISLIDINNFYQNEYAIFIITYNSSYKLSHLKFEFGIFDEAHRTTGIYNNEKINYKALVENININKKLFMTATMKIFNGDENKYYSMDDINIYGNIISNIGINEAMKLKRICPYTIITIDIKNEQNISIDNYLDKLSKKDRNKIEEIKNRYISIAYGLIRTIQKYNMKHVITFHSLIIYCDFFKYILNKISSGILIDTISGYDNKISRKQKINEFQNNNITILCSAKVLQEGVDIPKCDSIIFIDIKTSVVDTIQSFSRCLTYLDNKKAYIMIPFNEVTDIKNDEYTSNLRHILRTLVDIDDNLKEYFNKSIKENKSKCKTQFRSITDNLEFNILNNYDINIQIIENLQDITYLPFEIAKEKVFKKYKSEYEYVKNVINDFNNQIPNNPDKIYKKFGWKNWNEYLGIINNNIFNELKLKIKDKKINDPTLYLKYAKKNHLCINPKIVFNDEWTNWYEFLNINIDNYPKTKNEWKILCFKNDINSKNYKLNAEQYNLPLMPDELYTDFSNLSKELDIFDFY